MSTIALLQIVLATNFKNGQLGPAHLASHKLDRRGRTGSWDKSLGPLINDENVTQITDYAG